MRRFELIAWPFAALFDHEAAGGYELILSLPNVDTSLQVLSETFCAILQENPPAAIDRWVLDEAMSRLAAHIPLLSRQNVSITLNMSAQSFLDESFVRHFLATLAHYEVPCGLLTIQMPEASVTDDVATCARALENVRHAGCGVSLSEFGSTRKSHLAVATIPATRVKIDGRLMRNVLRRRKAQFAIKKIMGLIHGLPIDSIVDGVSSAAVARKMRAFGIDFAQGDIYGRAMPLLDAVDSVQQNAKLNSRLRPLTPPNPLYVGSFAH